MSCWSWSCHGNTRYRVRLASCLLLRFAVLRPKQKWALSRRHYLLSGGKEQLHRNTAQDLCVSCATTECMVYVTAYTEQSVGTALHWDGAHWYGVCYSLYRTECWHCIALGQCSLVWCMLQLIQNRVLALHCTGTVLTGMVYVTAYTEQSVGTALHWDGAHWYGVCYSLYRTECWHCIALGQCSLVWCMLQLIQNRVLALHCTGTVLTGMVYVTAYTEQSVGTALHWDGAHWYGVCYSLYRTECWHCIALGRCSLVWCMLQLIQNRVLALHCTGTVLTGMVYVTAYTEQSVGTALHWDGAHWYGVCYSLYRTECWHCIALGRCSLVWCMLQLIQNRVLALHCTGTVLTGMVYVNAHIRQHTVWWGSACQEVGA